MVASGTRPLEALLSTLISVPKARYAQNKHLGKSKDSINTCKVRGKLEYITKGALKIKELQG